MFSYGFQPWAAMTGQQILDSIDKPNCQRLEMPDCCPKEYYDTIMLKCWDHEPQSRPKFSELVTLLPQVRICFSQTVFDSSSNSFNRESHSQHFYKPELGCSKGHIFPILALSQLERHGRMVRMPDAQPEGRGFESRRRHGMVSVSRIP
jgi:hypothetical protein